jgi:subtilisin-like proprotein convertase family protein
VILATALTLEIVRHSLTGTHRRQVALPPPDRIVYESPLRPFAIEGDRRIPLFFNAKPARVFDPNPVAAINDPSLQDRNDAATAVPERAYDVIEVELNGPHVKLVDRQSPNVPPPVSETFFNREDDGFEYVNAYVHVDRTQRYLQSLGYFGERSIVPYAIEVDAHAASGGDNSFFVPSFTRIGEGTLFYGTGGTDDAEDADLVVHEYMHAMLEWIAPQTFGGTFASESRALSEGLGDYWAFSQHVARRRASGRDPYCFADWDARCWEDDPSERCSYAPGTDCLRRLDSPKTMADYDRRDSSGVEHRNGAIWSSALREIHEQLGKQLTDTIVLESLFDIPPHPTFAVAARRLIEADRLLYGGVHADVICSAMTARGIVANCDGRPRGELTLFQSGQRALVIPDNDPGGLASQLTIADTRAIERLLVRVDIEHRTRGDLRIELVAPDGTTVLLQQVSPELTPDIHATFGLDATAVESLDALRGRSAAGVWKLIVRDLRSRDVGTLVSWGLVIQFEGDVPLTTRPRGGRAQMIPVVTHVFGVNATRFRSDVRISNPSASRVTATLIYGNFSAMSVALEPGQTLAFDDVVASVFQTTGSGTLEVLGDVVVMSRTYAETSRGTMGQQIPPNLQTTAAGENVLFAAPLRTGSDRVNLGVSETAGGSGIVRIGGTDHPIGPYGRIQFPWSAEPVQIEVVSGNARVAAYLSQIDNTTGDPMFIPAVSDYTQFRAVIAPVISSEGVNGTEWRSDIWLAAFGGPSHVPFEAIGSGQRASAQFTLDRELIFADVLARMFHRTVTIAALRVILPPGAIGMSRVRANGTSQFVPMQTPEGPAEQHLVFVESSDTYRTNVGFVSDQPAVAEVVIHDAGGNEVTRSTLATTGGIAQMAVTPRITHGRAVVRFVEGRGRAYASLIDSRTSDATFVTGQ